MPRQCLFCDRNADSKEHLWSSWILGRRKWEPIRHSIGKSPVKIIATPELTVRTVCEPCNNDWMSALEAQNIQLIGCLMQDISAPLDASQQASLAAWALKTAMVLDSVSRRGRNFFYERSECEMFRVSSTIPERTNIWIGRSSVNSLGAFGTDFWIFVPDKTKVARGCATTIIVGHLAIQVLVVHVLPGHQGINFTFNPKPGQWNHLLLNIWPIGSRPITWPPPLTFTNSGSRSIARLMDRWRIGESA